MSSSTTPPSMADELDTNGVCVIKDTLFSDPRWRNELLEEATKFPEFLPGTKRFILGGFAALGNASSFHNPVVRDYRQWAMAILLERLFLDVLADRDGDWQLEQVIDRMVIREAGETPSAEIWHRDEGNIATTHEDVVYGGWINLDPEPQYLSCVLGSHVISNNSNGGFVKVSKEEAAEIKANQLSTRVLIPSGGIVVFHENIIHEVFAAKLKYRLVRLYLAWRLTPGESTMRNGLLEMLQSQAVVTIKSGQIPAMHAKLHWVNWVSKLQAWSANTMNRKCIERRTYSGEKRKGESFDVVHTHMRSLEEYGFPKYKEYTSEEIQMYRPSRSWDLLVPGQKRVKRTYAV